MVARQKIHAGMIHAGKTATVICENNHFRVVIDGETAAVVPRTTTSEVHRYKANATDKRYPGPAHPGRTVTPMPEVRLDAADAAELAEMLQFLSQWLARDPARLAASLEQFTGHPAYGMRPAARRPGAVRLPARRQRRRGPLRRHSGRMTTRGPKPVVAPHPGRP